MPKMRVYRGRVHLFDTRLDGMEAVIGRSAEAEIPLDSPAASRKHVRLTRRKWSWYAESLGTKNPALLNKRPFTAQRLKHGDTMDIADHTLVFEYPRSEQRKEQALVEGRAGAGFRLDEGEIQSALESGSHNKARLEEAKQKAAGGNSTQIVNPDDLAQLMEATAKRRAAHLVLVKDGARQEFDLAARTLEIGWAAGVQVRLPGKRLFGKVGARIVTTGNGLHRISPVSKWVKVLVEGEAVTNDRLLSDRDTVELRHAFGFGSAKLKYEAAVDIGPGRRGGRRATQIG